jgi:hypothetical protein
MSLDSIVEVWEILRDHVDLNDRCDVADSLVNYLMDNNFEVEDIKDAFKDKDITKALKGYAEQHFQEEEYEEYEDEDQDPEDWN